MSDEFVYNYSPVTFEYLPPLGEPQELEYDPVGHEPMIPANATIIATPDAGENQVAVFNPGLQTWSVQQDYRGETRYSTLNNGVPVLIVDIGPLPANTTANPRPENYVWNSNENDWVLSPE